MLYITATGPSCGWSKQISTNLIIIDQGVLAATAGAVAVRGIVGLRQRIELTCFGSHCGKSIAEPVGPVSLYPLASKAIGRRNSGLPAL